MRSDDVKRLWRLAESKGYLDAIEYMSADARVVGESDEAVTVEFSRAHWERWALFGARRGDREEVEDHEELGE